MEGVSRRETESMDELIAKKRGVLRLLRVESSIGLSLFGSKVKNRSAIALELDRADADGHSTGEPIAKVLLTESQLCRLITRVGVHRGTLCTIEYADGEDLVDFEYPVDGYLHRAGVSYIEDSNLVIEQLRSIVDNLRELPKAMTLTDQRKMVSKLQNVLSRLVEGQEYRDSKLRETLEEYIDEAEAEISAYARFRKENGMDKDVREWTDEELAGKKAEIQAEIDRRENLSEEQNLNEGE